MIIIVLAIIIIYNVSIILFEFSFVLQRGRPLKLYNQSVNIFHNKSQIL